MKRIVFASLVCAALVLAVALPSLFAVDAPADGIKLAYFAKVVTFNHTTHKAQDCKVCHHTWDGAAAIQKCSVAGCHDSMDKKDKTEKSLYNCIHGKGAHPTCLDCHKQTAGADKDKKSALTGCKGSKCHPE